MFAEKQLGRGSDGGAQWCDTAGPDGDSGELERAGEDECLAGALQPSHRSRYHATALSPSSPQTNPHLQH